MLDLRPATDEVARLLDGVDDADLRRPTPCPGTPVAALLDHFVGQRAAGVSGLFGALEAAMMLG